MILLAVTAETWIVTGLGFGIVLVLLFCLVYILQFFGWTMQKATAPKAPKEGQAPKAEQTASKAENDDLAAIAMALYLAQETGKHDAPTAMLTFKHHDTAWNPKSNGFNNVGF